MKKYIFFIVWLILAAGLAFVAFSSEDSDAILAEVEPRSYAVSFEKNVRVKELFVVFSNCSVRLKIILKI